jgi:uncharacterized repeat protein (TIGR01451 family)
MKKLYYLIILTLILGLTLTGCLLSNVGQVPTSDQSGVAYLTKGVPSNLVALWHFDGNAYDSSGTPLNDGTVQGGAAYDVTSFMGQALIFDGIDDYVEVAPADSLDMTDAYTIEAVVNVTDVPNNIYRPILFRGTTDVNDIEVYIQPISKGLVVAHNRLNGGTFDFVRFDPPPIGGWFHLAVTFDGTDVQAYYNSVLQAVTQNTTEMEKPLDTVNDWWIGKVDHTAFGTLSGGDDINLFKGLIEEVWIWDKALLPGDILNPAISVVKIADTEFACPGDTVFYEYTVTNTGYVPLSGVDVTDSLGIIVSHDSGDDNTNGFLDLEEDWIFTADYIVPSDVDSPLVNTATALGTNPLDNKVVEAEDSWSVVICYHEETAWAYGEEGVAKPNNGVEGNSSNAWGWTNQFVVDTEFPFELALWAAAGQNNTDNGFLVGTVTVDLVDGCVKVDYLITNTNQDYTITEAHLWVGNTDLPMVKQGKKDVPTSAPGQFPFSPEIAIDEKSATIKVCEVDVDDLNLENFWVAAHAVIEWCECPEEE